MTYAAGTLLGAMCFSSIVLPACVVDGEEGAELEQSSFVDASSTWVIRVVRAACPGGTWDVDGSAPDLTVRTGFWEAYDPAVHPCNTTGYDSNVCLNVGTVASTPVAYDTFAADFYSDTVVFTGEMLNRFIGLDVTVIDDDVPGGGEVGWGTEMASFTIEPYSLPDYLVSGGVFLGGPAEVELAFVCLAGCP